MTHPLERHPLGANLLPVTLQLEFTAARKPKQRSEPCHSTLAFRTRAGEQSLFEYEPFVMGRYQDGLKLNGEWS